MDFGEPPTAGGLWILLFVVALSITGGALKFGLFGNRRDSARLGLNCHILALALTVGLMILARNSETHRALLSRLSIGIGLVNLFGSALSGLGAFCEEKPIEKGKDSDHFRCLQCGADVEKTRQRCPACGWTWK